MNFPAPLIFTGRQDALLIGARGEEQLVWASLFSKIPQLTGSGGVHCAQGVKRANEGSKAKSWAENFSCR